MTDNLNLQAERELFEASEGAHGGDLSKAWGFGTKGEYADPYVEARWQGWLMARRATNATIQQGEDLPPLPDVLFDGNAVYTEITNKLGKAHCHNHETVSATLDAVVRIMRREIGAACRASKQGEDDARDAARYRWLRDMHNEGDEQWFVYGATSIMPLDECIDAARASQPGADK